MGQVSFSSIYAIAQGRMYNENSVWMDGSRYDNSGAYTTGVLIKNPMHVIESIYRDELGAGDLINTASFDAVAEKRKDWLCSGTIYGSNQAKSVINEIAQQFGIRIYHLGSQIYASVWDWWVDTAGKSTIKLLNKDNIADTSMKLTKTPKVYNSFEVNYCYSYAWKKYRYRHYCNTTSDSHTTEVLYPYAASANTNYFNEGTSEHLLSLNVNWINDKSTGQRLLEYLVRKYSKRWYQIEFEAYYDGALILEPCDCIKIIHSRLPAEINGKKWEVVKIRINMDSHIYEVTAICAETP